MQNFATLTSDKAHYRSPTRGAQGNALKTIIGIPHALGVGSEPVIIEGRGVRHTIKPVIDAAGVPRLPRKVEASERTTGTKVTVSLPEDRIELDPFHWGRAFAMFNPYAFIKIEQFDEGTEQVTGFRKWVDFINRPLNRLASTSQTIGAALTGTTRRRLGRLSART